MGFFTEADGAGEGSLCIIYWGEGQRGGKVEEGMDVV